MKNVRLFVFAAFVAAMFASCQKEEQFEGQQNQQGQQELTEVPTIPLEFSANTENASISRLSLGKGLKPAWEEGDEIGIHDGVKVQQFVLSDLENAVFSGSISETATELYAMYPYEAVKSFVGGKYTASIPDVQVIEAGDSIATDALLAMAHPVVLDGNPVHFAFKNVCGLVRFEIFDSDQVKEFVLVGNKGEKFTGEGVIGLETRIENENEVLVPVFTPSENASSIVRVRPAGDNATFAKGTYYAAVAPVIFSEGFSTSLVTVNDAATVSKGTDKEMTVPRNSGTGLQDLVKLSEWNWKIYTKEQLIAWNQAPTSSNHKVELMADIDMEGVEWAPSEFRGEFEGNGNKIYNFVINRDGHCGLVSFLNGGSIKNLVLGSKDGVTYDGVSKFTYNPEEKEAAGSWVHVGSAAAKVDRDALIENVTNFIHLETPDGPGLAKVCMGGITSMGTYKETIKNCVNYGNITCNATIGAVTGASNHQLGGIIAKTDGSTQIIGCKNYGTITAGGAYVDNIGGIIANPNGNGSEYYDAAKKNEVKDVLPLIKDCYNYGNIVVTKAVSDAEATPMALGGIVGKLTGATVENCHNQGNISSVCDVLTAMGGVAGRHAYAFESKIDGCSNGVSGSSDKGILSFSPANGTQQAVLGGILGYTDWIKSEATGETDDNGDEIKEVVASGKVSIQNCNNYAPINFSYNKMRMVGGVVGACAKISTKDAATISCEVLIDNCHNYGDITIGGSGSFGGWQRQIGGVVGAVNGSMKSVEVSNCSNNATLSTTATGGGEHRLSGIIGYAYASGSLPISVKSCNNFGEVKATGSATNPRPAGIVSVMDGTGVTVNGCYNKGKISTASSVGNVYIGGITAYSVRTTITDCHNEGDVQVTKTGNQIRMGGIAGQQTTSGKVLQCTNSATVNSSAEITGVESQIGGIVGFAASNALVQSCKNKSTAIISVTGALEKPKLGGIVGHSEVTVQDCHNEGRVELTKTAGLINMGGIVGCQKSVAKVLQCTNAADVYCAANYVASESQIGGMVGRSESGTQVTNCTNKSTATITVTGSSHNPRIGGITGFTESVTITDNVNEGHVTTSTVETSKKPTPYVGGIAGWAKNLTIENCQNKGLVDATACSNIPYVSGILGKASTNVTIKNCRNAQTGKVHCDVSTGTFFAGGIIAQCETTTILQYCYNDGEVKINQKAQNAYVGGIVGRALNVVENCENTSTGVVIVQHSGSNSKYALAGGIAGRGGGTVTLKNCVNNGTVKAIVNTTNHLTGAGGITGYPNQMTLIGNVNNGYVYAENKHTTEGKAYAGGIFATDVEKADNVGATSVTGNKNYGKVELKSVKSAANPVLTSMPGAAAGGLFGLVGKTVNTAIAADNYNYGEVVATEAGANGPAGALAGASNIASWSGNVGKNVKVNGVLWNAWAEGADAAWLCPVATNAVTATYVEAPAN